MAMQEDKELQEFRDLMKPPEEFHEGFGAMTMVGAVFMGFLMMPASMYLALMMGQCKHLAGMGYQEKMWINGLPTNYTQPSLEIHRTLFVITPIVGHTRNAWRMRSQLPTISVVPLTMFKSAHLRETFKLLHHFITGDYTQVKLSLILLPLWGMRQYSRLPGKLGHTHCTW